jgi:hypothetical protein
MYRPPVVLASSWATSAVVGSFCYGWLVEAIEAEHTRIGLLDAQQGKPLNQATPDNVRPSCAPRAWRVTLMEAMLADVELAPSGNLHRTAADE